MAIHPKGVDGSPGHKLVHFFALDHALLHDRRLSFSSYGKGLKAQAPGFLVIPTLIFLLPRRRSRRFLATEVTGWAWQKA